MAYLDQSDPRKKLASVSIVALVHVGLGLGLVAGLTITYTQPPDEPIFEGHEVKYELPPPDPEVTPDPMPTASSDNPWVYVPDRTFDLPPTGPSDTTSEFQLDDGTGPIAGPTSDPIHTPVPDPIPTLTPRAPRPANSGWVTTDDYPRRALERGWEGVVTYALDIGANGRVENCRVTSSSGRDVLDTTACRMIEQRARFDPATDHNGARVAGSWRGSVQWAIPDD